MPLPFFTTQELPWVGRLQWERHKGQLVRAGGTYAARKYNLESNSAFCFNMRHLQNTNNDDNTEKWRGGTWKMMCSRFVRWQAMQGGVGVTHCAKPDPTKVNSFWGGGDAGDPKEASFARAPSLPTSSSSSPECARLYLDLCSQPT